MNSLYTLGLRQTSAIQADLERLRNGDVSVSLLGQISASLAAFNRTVDDYDSMAKREMIKAKQEKAFMRVQKFRTDYNDLRKGFEHSKLLAENAVRRPPKSPVDVHAQSQRADLFQTPNASSTRQRFQAQPSPVSESPFNIAPPPTSRQDHALNEHTFLQETETQLDNFLAQGQEVLNNLIDQRRDRLLDAANTLGLSRDVIGWIERRRAVFTFFCFWLTWHYLG
ncbi:hypothetical protein BS47DRAFT_1370785 [Hydnum rufescens UP504]|uniref:Protein transport protein BOS1 n=1 Tax=Hydnum rufescens UP504 TaxID=1448309 RepID=A0A9P6B8C6_9AGAM|nr:hypothetical protein BS47DRAFT_1370785 [Hydnum rufescens UP504]